MDNKLIIGIVSVAVSIIVVAGILVPAIDNAEIATSIETNYDNDTTYFKMATSSDVVTVSLSSGTVTLNGEAVTQTTNSNILLSDAFSLDQFQYQGNWLNRVWFKDSTQLEYPKAFNLTFEDGDVTGSYTDANNVQTTISDTYTYLYFASADGDYTQFSTQSSGWKIYVNKTTDIILSGLYTTGDNDCTYSYVNGVMSAEGFESSVSFTSESVAIDAFEVTGIEVTIGGESFTPWRALVPSEVIAHERTSASMLFAVIPMLVIVAILVGVAAVVFRNRD